jgi:RNA polymerase sigma-70 factor (ECF subfamily)
VSAGHPLAAAFLETCPSSIVDRPLLEIALGGLLTRARERYPRLTVDDVAYARHLGGRLEAGEAVLEALASLNADDLFLAFACATGDASAIAIFEEDCMRRAEGAVGRKGVSRDVIEEAKQNVRERMLVADGAPKILDYNGRGDLKNWLRVAVVREAIYLSKKADKEGPLSYELFTFADPAVDPEIGYFKARYRAEYKAAFEAAITQLEARERSLLRQQYVLGMTVDQIGTIYQVHRATAARWVQSAREELLSKARFELAKRTGLSRAELESIVRMIESQLNVSLNRLLVSRAR